MIVLQYFYFEICSKLHISIHMAIFIAVFNMTISSLIVFVCKWDLNPSRQGLCTLGSISFSLKSKLATRYFCGIEPVFTMPSLSDRKKKSSKWEKDWKKSVDIIVIFLFHCNWRLYMSQNWLPARKSPGISRRFKSWSFSRQIPCHALYWHWGIYVIWWLVRPGSQVTNGGRRSDGQTTKNSLIWVRELAQR